MMGERHQRIACCFSANCAACSSAVASILASVGRIAHSSIRDVESKPIHIHAASCSTITLVSVDGEPSRSPLTRMVTFMAALDYTWASRALSQSTAILPVSVVAVFSRCASSFQVEALAETSKTVLPRTRTPST